MTAIYAALLNTMNSIVPAEPEQTSVSPVLRSTAFNILQATVGLDSYDDFFAGDVLAHAAEQIYTGTMPQFVIDQLTTGAHQQKRATTDAGATDQFASVKKTENRLMINWIPVIIVSSGLGLLILFIIGLDVLGPQNVVPRDPNTIAAAATILSRSHELNRLLQRSQDGNTTIPASLDGYEVGTAIALTDDGAKSFKIHVTEGRRLYKSKQSTSDSGYWHPFLGSIPVLVVTVLPLIALIVFLELAQRKSDANQGLLNVLDTQASLYASHYIPAFVALVLTALVNNIDFFIVLFSPWSKMIGSGATAKTSVLGSVLGHTSLPTLVKALSGSHPGAAFSTLATIAACLLTVVISGLFQIEGVTGAGPGQHLTALDTFDFGANHSVSDDKGAATMLNLIQHNLTYPAFTWDELALPSLHINSTIANQATCAIVTGSTTGNVTAYRGNLICNDATVLTAVSRDNAITVYASFDVPQSCQQAADQLNSSTVSISTNFGADSASNAFAGKQLDLRFGSNSSIYGVAGESNSEMVGDNPSAGCPSLVFIWGNVISTGAEMRAAICTQYIESVSSNIVLQPDSTIFDPTRPPVPYEKTAKNVSNPAASGINSFDFRIQSNLARQIGTTNILIDAFFQALLTGNVSNVVDLTKDRATGTTAINKLYRQYMAQVLNAVMRTPPLNPVDAIVNQQSLVLNDLQTTVATPRLVQDRISTYILEVLLAISAVFITIGYFLTKMRHVLTVNPCSIAGTMSLLAGSDLCYAPDDGLCECCGKARLTAKTPYVTAESIAVEDEEPDFTKMQIIRPGAEWMDNSHFRHVFEPHRFSLGWWAVGSSR
ncbi:hypothetical protein LTR66_016276, partial [Elasticomyces elasticus]